MSVTIAARRLSELIPEKQAVEIRELIRTPFSAVHRNEPVTVQAVFVRTAIVRRSEAEAPYQVPVGEVEVNEHDVATLSPREAVALTSWRGRVRSRRCGLEEES
jgi:hypothetical protein